MIFIINLEKNKDRREIIEGQLNAYGITDYEFVTAIDGDDLTTPLVPFSIASVNRKNVDKRFAKHFSNKEIACLKSHVLAIDRAVEEDLDYAIILEDDVVLCEDWNARLKKLLRIVPKKWNHLFLSGFPAEKENQWQSLNFAPFLHVERSRSTMGAFSYVLKKETYERVKEGYLSFTEPTDNIIEGLIKSGSLVSFTFFPFLTYHDNDVVSEIWGTEYPTDHESKRYFVKNIS